VIELINRGRYHEPQRVEEEFESIIRRLRGYLSQSFDEDGELIVADPNLAVVPVGAVQDFAGATAPSGWLFCNGAQVSRITYKSLFEVISTTYGAGDGSTTFNVPDCRQRFVLGKAASGTGDDLGETGGAINHVHTGPSHAHSISSDGNHSHTVDSHTHDLSSHTHGTGTPPTSDASGEPQDTVDKNLDGATVVVSLPAHNHNVNNSVTDGPSTNVSGSTSPGTTTAGAHTHGGSTGSSGTGNTGTADPPFIALNKIIFAGVA
jgi:microcystin-dependent protein